MPKHYGSVISVLNMKGGVGKTTICAHVIPVLSQRLNKTVLLVDLDPQFNLTQTLIPRTTYNQLKQGNKTVFTAMEPPSSVGLFDVATTHHAPPKATDLSHRLKKSYIKQWAIDLVPGNFDLVKYSLVSEPSKLSSVQQRFQKFISQARQDYDIVIIDCNPSSSFITLCALRTCTHLLVPVRPDLYSVLGLELVADFLQRLPDIEPKPEIAVLLNGIPRSSYDRTAEDELRAHASFGPLVLTNKLRKSRLLEASSI